MLRLLSYNIGYRTYQHLMLLCINNLQESICLLLQHTSYVNSSHINQQSVDIIISIKYVQETHGIINCQIPCLFLQIWDWIKTRVYLHRDTIVNKAVFISINSF